MEAVARCAASMQIHLLSPSHLVSGFTCTGLWGNTWEFSFPIMEAGKYFEQMLCINLACMFTCCFSLNALRDCQLRC